MKIELQHDKSDPIAIATSDWHFWHIPPVWRSNEPDWLEAMERQLRQVVKESYIRNIPILCAGDIFDHFNPNPETINRVVGCLKNPIYAVPGQHDLEHHNLATIHRTGFATMLHTGYIKYRNDGFPITDEKQKFDVYFAPWGTDISQIVVKPTNRKKILLAHKYVWLDDKTRYGGQDIPSGKLCGLKENLQKFDFAIFGDNHIPFTAKVGRCMVINPGTMVRRKLDERNHKTGCYVLFIDGNIDFIQFNIDKDVNLEVRIEEEKTDEVDFSSRQFMEKLRTIQDDQIDYRTEIEHKVSEMKRPDMEKQFAEIFDNYEENER